MGESKKQPKYGKFPSHDLEEVEYSKSHGVFKKGDKNMVHPNTAILLRYKGIAVDVPRKAAQTKSKKQE